MFQFFFSDQTMCEFNLCVRTQTLQISSKYDDHMNPKSNMQNSIFTVVP